MKTIFLFVVLLMLSINTNSQTNFKQSWSFGLGVSNHTMAGDHRSIRTGLSDGADANNILNLGGYLYVDKMFSSAFGLELKGFYSTMSGAGQELTSNYAIVGTSVPLRNTYFNGNAYGADLSLILNLSNLAKNPYKTKPRKWNLASYIGIGIQQYDSKLYDERNDVLLADYGNSPSSNGAANSTYYTFGLGLRYKVSKKIDIEFRPTVNLNEEDNLDAAMSAKQTFEVFYMANLGLVFKLNDKEHDNYVWHVDEVKEEVNVEDLIAAKIKEYDENRDTDKDGFADVTDPCPLRYSKSNKGCPGDRDKDGVLDDLDLCPDVAGLKDNHGCPTDKVEATPVVVQQPTKEESKYDVSLFDNVYFDLDSAILTRDTADKLNKVIVYMKLKPEASIVLQGNTDAGGPNDYNRQLSERRSKTVMSYITARGIDPSRIEVIGYGEEFPKFKNLPINRNNRRVDILLK